MMKRLFKLTFLVVTGLHLAWLSALVLLRYVNPPTTGVQIQRRLESLWNRTSYQKHYTFVPIGRISSQLKHAVVSAEDGRFFSHNGIDWDEVEKVVEETSDDGSRARGASTITQQLVKNLFFTTHRNPIRKVFEYSLAPMADAVLGKDRSLELYLNIVEWGPGVIGAEEAARYHYGTSARLLDRERAARLAACLPSPLRRKPARMNQYSAAILLRMEKVGW